MKESVSELTRHPDEGCYIHGLFLEGARWDPAAFQLAESRPKELYTEMAVIWLLPVPNRQPPATGSYLCPIYKTLTRAGRCPEDRAPEAKETGEAAREGSPGGLQELLVLPRADVARGIIGRDRENGVSAGMEQTGTLAVQQCLRPGSPQAHTPKFFLFLFRSACHRLAQGWDRGSHVGSDSLVTVQQPGLQYTLPPLASPYRHAVNNRPLHQLRDCCGDPYRQATEALDQTGHGLDLCPGLLARKPTQAGAGPPPPCAEVSSMGRQQLLPFSSRPLSSVNKPGSTPPAAPSPGVVAIPKLPHF